jgi:hypothetical protein
VALPLSVGVELLDPLHRGSDGVGGSIGGRAGAEDGVDALFGVLTR